jgi:hypothetical protein
MEVGCWPVAAGRAVGVWHHRGPPRGPALSFRSQHSVSITLATKAAEKMPKRVEYYTVLASTSADLTR